MDLREAGIGEQRALLISAPDGRGVATLGVGREVIDVAVTARSKHHGVGCVRLNLAGDQVARDNASGAAIHHHQVEHFSARIHLHLPAGDLPLEGLIGAQQQLLAGLAAGVESAGDLRTAEGAVIQHAAVLPGEGYALRHALVDDIHADLSQPVNVGLARAKIAALDGVVEQPVDAVAVPVIVFGRVNASLRGDAVGAPRGILEAKALDVVAQLPQRRGRRSAGQP